MVKRKSKTTQHPVEEGKETRGQRHGERRKEERINKNAESARGEETGNESEEEEQRVRTRADDLDFKAKGKPEDEKGREDQGDSEEGELTNNEDRDEGESGKGERGSETSDDDDDESEGESYSDDDDKDEDDDGREEESHSDDDDEDDDDEGEMERGSSEGDDSGRERESDDSDEDEEGKRRNNPSYKAKGKSKDSEPSEDEDDYEEGETTNNESEDESDNGNGESESDYSNEDGNERERETDCGEDEDDNESERVNSRSDEDDGESSSERASSDEDDDEREESECGEDEGDNIKERESDCDEDEDDNESERRNAHRGEDDDESSSERASSEEDDDERERESDCGEDEDDNERGGESECREDEDDSEDGESDYDAADEGDSASEHDELETESEGKSDYEDEGEGESDDDDERKILKETMNQVEKSDKEDRGRIRQVKTNREDETENQTDEENIRTTNQNGKANGRGGTRSQEDINYEEETKNCEDKARKKGTRNQRDETMEEKEWRRQDNKTKEGEEAAKPEGRKQEDKTNQGELEAVARAPQGAGWGGAGGAQIYLAEGKAKESVEASTSTSTSSRPPEGSGAMSVRPRTRGPREREGGAEGGCRGAGGSTVRASAPETRPPQRDLEVARSRSSGGTGGGDPEFRPEALAEYLGQRRGFQAPEGEMRAQFSWQVNRALALLPHIFCLRDDQILLRPKIRVCSAYTSRNGCTDRASCIDIHICPDFIFGGCENEHCGMGHSLSTKHNTRAIQDFYLGGLNDKQLHLLLKMTEVAFQWKTAQPYLDVCEHTNSPQRTSVQESVNQQNIGAASKKNRNIDRSAQTSRTKARSPVPEGSHQLSEICSKSVSGKCKDNGCPRLHSKRHFHWQVTANFVTWYDFPETHVLFLEEHFCDPANDLIFLQKLDDSCPDSALLSLLGNRRWDIGFLYAKWENNCAYIPIRCNELYYDIRRLCSERSHKNIIRANRFIWYFPDDSQKWVPFDAVNNKRLEEAFQRDPQGRVQIGTDSASYRVDFSKMKQENVSTKTERWILRRPLPMQAYR